MNIWITEQVVIVIHLQALCRACKVFCLEPVVLLSRGFLTERLKWGRGEREHRCYWVALLLRKNDLCLQMPPLPVFGASCYAPVPFLFSGYHAGIKTCHLPRWWTAGHPPKHPQAHTSYASEVLPPRVYLRCSFTPYPKIKTMSRVREVDPRNRRRQTLLNSFILLFHPRTGVTLKALKTTSVLKDLQKKHYLNI